MEAELKRIRAHFYRNESGNEPVREWLLSLSRDDRREIGRGLMTLEFGWPIGMPFARPMGKGLHELRIDISFGRSSRILFYVDAVQRLVILHGFLKTTRTTPKRELNIARRRMALHQRNNK